MAQVSMPRKRGGASTQQLAAVAALALAACLLLYTALSFGEVQHAWVQADEQGSGAQQRQWQRAAAARGGRAGAVAAEDAEDADAEDKPAMPAPSDEYVTVELRLPPVPPTLNNWTLASSIMAYHQQALQAQLEQAYVGLALAAAAGRRFVLPQFSCFCHQAPRLLPRCRRKGAGGVRFPQPCLLRDVLAPLQDFTADAPWRGMALRVEAHHAADQIDESETVVLRPNASLEHPACAGGAPLGSPMHRLRCMRESRQKGGAEVVTLPLRLNDSVLMPLLQLYEKAKLWRLDFQHVPSHWDAFAGWDCAEPAHAFDRRLSDMVRPWPRHAGGGLRAMSMTGGRTYSQQEGLKDARACPTGAVARAARVRAAAAAQAREMAATASSRGWGFVGL